MVYSCFPQPQTSIYGLKYKMGNQMTWYHWRLPQKQEWHWGVSWGDCLQIHKRTLAYRWTGTTPLLSLWLCRCPMPLLLDLNTKKADYKHWLCNYDRWMVTSLPDMKPTFAQLEGKLLSSVSAWVEMSTIQKCAHIMYKHFVTGHRQLCACAFPFHPLENTQK